MWFKNLTLFRFTESFTLPTDDLNARLEEGKFRPCGSLELASFGWTSPLGRDGDELAYALNGYIMVCFKKEEKLLPGSVVNEVVARRAEEAEERNGAPLGRRERGQLRDEVIAELLPKAFTHSRKTYAYIDTKGGWLVVDSASAKKAEELVSHLRRCLGSLPVAPPVTRERPAAVMTQWLATGTGPSDFTIDDECELRSTEAEGGVVRCKRQDLTVPEVQNHIEAGKEVVKLALSWGDRIGFLLSDDLGVKRLKFLDVIQEQAAEVEAGSEAERFDIDFSILSLELSGFVPRLLALFGGENEPKSSGG
ncbi:MAG: recombination-associated protein RdgC [Methylococcaceae bacterium]|nr:recombination-associated protein RdgC [Desulfuromonas sp.]NJD07465.1 recombination-associated protein RdgC [Methylococcaceae bacterium]